jgi:hypothetical protein
VRGCGALLELTAGDGEGDGEGEAEGEYEELVIGEAGGAARCAVLLLEDVEEVVSDAAPVSDVSDAEDISALSLPLPPGSLSPEPVVPSSMPCRASSTASDAAVAFAALLGAAALERD